MQGTHTINTFSLNYYRACICAAWICAFEFFVWIYTHIDTLCNLFVQPNNQPIHAITWKTKKQTMKKKKINDFERKWNWIAKIWKTKLFVSLFVGSSLSIEPKILNCISRDFALEMIQTHTWIDLSSFGNLNWNCILTGYRQREYFTIWIAIFRRFQVFFKFETLFKDFSENESRNY